MLTRWSRRAMVSLWLLSAFRFRPAAAVHELPPPSHVHHELVATRNLEAAVSVVVLAPPSTPNEGRRFPVLYFLHDGYGDENVLVREGVAGRLYEAMRMREVPEFFIVAPRGDGSWFVDSWDQKVRYGAFLSEELIPAIESRFPAGGTRTSRVVAGVSMGGYGALRWGLVRPDFFVAVGGASPAVVQLSWRTVDELPFFIRPSFKRVFGRAELENSFRQNDLYDLLLSRPDLGQTAPEILIRCGTEDRYRLGEVSTLFKRVLDAMGLKNEIRLEPGQHDWAYWRRSLPSLFGSLASRFSGEPAPLAAR